MTMMTVSRHMVGVAVTGADVQKARKNQMTTMTVSGHTVRVAMTGAVAVCYL